MIYIKGFSYEQKFNVKIYRYRDRNRLIYEIQFNGYKLTAAKTFSIFTIYEKDQP